MPEQNLPGPTTASSGSVLVAPAVTARAVEAAYGEEVVLHGVDLDVAPGEVVALLGPSGSGKSTLLYCLAGILTPRAGSVTTAGVDVTGATDAERTRMRRERLGFVLQFGRLVADLTTAENVSLPLRLNGVGRREAEAEAVLALEKVGLGDFAARRSTTLSGGQQQRVAVVRSLIHRPRVVFADEPTGALDSRNGQVVIDLLLGSAREQDAAVVMVTHDQALAEQADRQVHLRDGHLA